MQPSIELSHSASVAHQRAPDVDSRLDELRGLAVEDNVPWSDASEQDLRAFLAMLPSSERPMIVHLDNGNLRAIWNDGQDRHVGIQFIGGRVAQYVLTTRRSGADFLSQARGRDSFAGALDQIAAMGLREFVAA